MSVIADQLNSIKDDMYQWAQSFGGNAEVCSDMHHFWIRAWVKSDAPRVLIVYVGEEIRGPFSIAASTHRVDRTFNVMVTRGRGYNPNRGDSLTQQVGTALPLFELVEQARDILRAKIDISAELPPDFKSIRSFPVGDIVLDAYIIEFSVATDLLAIAATPDNPGPPIITP